MVNASSQIAKSISVTSQVKQYPSREIFLNFFKNAASKINSSNSNKFKSLLCFMIAYSQADASIKTKITIDLDKFKNYVDNLLDINSSDKIVAECINFSDLTFVYNIKELFKDHFVLEDKDISFFSEALKHISNKAKIDVESPPQVIELLFELIESNNKLDKYAYQSA